MKTRVKIPLWTAITIAFGLVTLLGYFIQAGLLMDMRLIFLRWAVILSAVALLIGVINLASVHLRKISAGQAGAINSMILLIAMGVTMVIAVISGGPTSSWSMWIFNNIQVPAESSLMALLAIILAYASARLLHRRLNIYSLIFLGTALIILVGTISFPGIDIPGLSELKSWISTVLAAAGARGILLGVALGTVATGLRVMLGADRPYGG